jgi:hypothetical protein
MSQNLTSDITGRVDFHADRNHFERRPMLMLRKILQQLGSRLGIHLIAGITYTSNISNELIDTHTIDGGITYSYNLDALHLIPQLVS